MGSSFALGEMSVHMVYTYYAHGSIYFFSILLNNKTKPETKMAPTRKKQTGRSRQHAMGNRTQTKSKPGTTRTLRLKKKLSQKCVFCDVSLFLILSTVINNLWSRVFFLTFFPWCIINSESDARATRERHNTTQHTIQFLTW